MNKHLEAALLVLAILAGACDRATFKQPHHLATGMVHVFVNGEQVLRDG